jgi:VWFA-related protein
MRVSHRPILALIGTLIAFLTAGSRIGPTQDQAVPQSQRPGPPGTIRINVRLVPVDVIVTDDRGRPVTDLKREDFQIFENGRLQDIRHFTVQTFTGASTEQVQAAAPPLSSINEVAPQTTRTFLIMMGRGRHQLAFKSVDALIRFVREGLSPQDRVAVFAYDRATDFTTDHEKIAQVLERYKALHEKIESWLDSRFSGLAAVYASKEIPKSFQNEIDKIFIGPEGLASRQVLPGRMTPGGTIVNDLEKAVSSIRANTDRAAEDTLRLAQADAEATDSDLPSAVMQSILAFDKLQSDMILTYLPFDEFAPIASGSFQDMQNIFTCIEYLRYMSGEKHLLFFSDQGLLFPSGKEEYDKNIAAAASDARVAIDTFQTGGTFLDPQMIPTTGQVQTAPGEAPPPPEISQSHWSRTFMLSSMRTVAQLTGGQAAIHEDIDQALNRINETSRVEYLLGYYPKDENWNGKYRDINVKVNRSGVKVFFRHGYFAREKLEPFNLDEFVAYNRVLGAGGYEKEIGDVPFKISTTKLKDILGADQVRVDLQIDCTKITLKPVEDRHAGKLRITIFYADKNGNYLGAEWKLATLRLLDSTYQRYMQSGLPLSIPVPLKTPKQILKVIVYDTASDRVGSKQIQVK